MSAMRSPSEIPEVTRNLEIGFLEYLSGLAANHGGWELVRTPHPVRSGASCVLRNRLGVELILEVEATWEPTR